MTLSQETTTEMCWYVMAIFVFPRESNSLKNNFWKTTYDKHKPLTLMGNTYETVNIFVSTLRV